MVAGVLLVGWTGWLILDPLIALLVAANIVWVGLRILNEAAHGLLDTALPPEDLAVVEGVQERYREEGSSFTRCASAAPAREGSSACTFWFRARGRWGAATTSRRTWSARSCRRCR